VITYNRIKWNKFIKELSNLIFFWFFGVVFFTLFRCVFIFLFRQQIKETTGLNEILKGLYAGFKFDCTAVSYFLIIPFFLLLILSPFNIFKVLKKIRLTMQYLFIIFSSLISLITLNYFKEYNDQFNNFLFLALYDDQKAVFKTILEEFNPLLNLFTFASIVILSVFIFDYFENKNYIRHQLSKIKFKRHSTVIILVSIFMFIGSIRGSFGNVPAIRKWSSVSKDQFINKTIINPYRSFKYALEDFRYLNRIEGENPFLSQEKFKLSYNNKQVTEALLKKTNGPTIKKPKQVFLVIMESYDSWPLMDKYLSFNLSQNLNRLANSGTHYNNFLPASSSTFNSYASIVTNVPYCGVNLSAIGAINEPFQTSLFRQFKKLGYEINFFYGGFLSWQKIGEFSIYNGVENLYSGVDVNKDLASGNWGIPDDKLFDMVLQKTDTTRLSLNIILTTSYHSPYRVDVNKKGFPYRTKDNFPEAIKPYYDDAMTIKELGHLWYSDKAIGDFVAKAENKYKESIFCFTGDHFGRRFINYNPNLYERSLVPFILYGNDIPKQINKTPGSHIDIMPTLIEMIAPKDFEYYSFGKSLLDNNKNYGIGFSKAITHEGLYHFKNNDKVEKSEIYSNGKIGLSKDSLKVISNKLMGLSWHYIMKGNAIK